MVTLPPFVAAYALHSWQFSSPRKPSSNVFPCPLSAIPLFSRLPCGFHRLHILNCIYLLFLNKAILLVKMTGSFIASLQQKTQHATSFPVLQTHYIH